MPKFPNKMISEAYEAARGHVFTWSPARHIFTDQNGSCEYNYDAMIWLREHGWLVELPYDLGNGFSRKFAIKEPK